MDRKWQIHGIFSSLIIQTVSHINYGILIWSLASDRILKLQKKNCINHISVNIPVIIIANTRPLFKELTLLKVMEIYKLNEFTEPLPHIYIFINNKLPQYFFQQLPLTPDNTIHNHTTHHRQNVYITRANNKFSQLCTQHSMPHLINNACPLIKFIFVIY